jgi:CheY-like chemotaxis protein
VTAEASDVELFYVDDMEDEIFVTQLALKRGSLALEVSYFLDSAELLSSLNDRLDKGKALPGLIVTDLNMPGLSGFDLIPKLKQDTRFEGILVGACTGSEDPADKVAALAAGADVFLTKPLDRSAIQRVCQETGVFQLHTTTDGKERLIPAGGIGP